LTEYNNDIPKYLQFLTMNLKLISLTGAKENEHNDLIPHILLQLRGTTIPVFQQSILKWQREYYENKLSLTPQTLVSKADQECQILTQAGQWAETIDPSITALQATLQATTQQSGELLKTIVANFSQVSHRQRDLQRSSRPTTRPPNRSSGNQTPEWVYDPPKYQDQIRHFNGRYWHFLYQMWESRQMGLHPY
jgi:hypothetical protein